MPTIVDPAASLPKHTSLLRAGRKPGAKSKPNLINIRREMETVYQLLGGTQSLWEWAQTEQGKKEFYPLVLKVLASYEMKLEQTKTEPIRVVVYGQQGQQVSISGSPNPVTFQGNDSGMEDAEQGEAGGFEAGRGRQ